MCSDVCIAHKCIVVVCSMCVGLLPYSVSQGGKKCIEAHKHIFNDQRGVCVGGSEGPTRREMASIGALHIGWSLLSCTQQNYSPRRFSYSESYVHL